MRWKQVTTAIVLGILPLLFGTGPVRASAAAPGAAGPSDLRAGRQEGAEQEPMTGEQEAVLPAADGPEVEMSLLDAVEHALRHNLQVQVSSMDPSVAEEGIRLARAPFDASIVFDVPQTFNRSTSPQASQLGGADVLTNETLATRVAFNERLEWGTEWGVEWSGSRFVTNNEFSTFNPQFDSSLAFQVRQPLLRDFGSDVNRRGIRVARNDFSVSREEFRRQVQNTIFLTYQAYWELVFAQRNLEVARQSLELAREQLERNRKQVRIGTMARIETVQSEQRVADAEFSVVQAEIALSDAQDNLKRLVNVEAFAPAGWNAEVVPTGEPEYEPVEIDVEGAIATAMENDPFLEQLRIQQESRELDLAFARNQTLPSIDLTGRFSLDGLGGDRIIRTGALGGSVSEIQEGGFNDAVEQLFSGDFRNWSVGVSISFPLHNHQAEAQRAQASIRERQATKRIADRKQQVRVAVQQAARQLVGGGEAVVASRKARDLAERQLAAEQRRFEVGTSTNFLVLEFQRTLAAARTRELRALIDFNVARARLEQAKGTLLESLGISLAAAGRGSP